jgi:4-hydroxy-tetrahydrodipicolinate reductase
MGQAVVEAVEAADGLELAAKADPEVGTTIEEALPAGDVMVDFTTPEAAPENVKQAINAGVHVVVGSTGFDLTWRARMATPSASSRPTSRSARC